MGDDDKLRMQTLREQGFGTKAIVAKCPHKGWKLVTYCYKHLTGFSIKLMKCLFTLCYGRPA